jgi:hypothetical protein
MSHQRRPNTKKNIFPGVAYFRPPFDDGTGRRELANLPVANAKKKDKRDGE